MRWASQSPFGTPENALAQLRFYRPEVGDKREIFEQKIKELNATGDTRVVYVNEGDWIMIELIITKLRRPLPLPPEGWWGGGAER